MDYVYYLFVILAFFAVAGLIEGLILTWNAYRGPEAVRIKRRLQAMSAGVQSVETPLLKKRLLSEVPLLERLLLEMPRIKLVDRLLVQAGSKVTVATFLGTCVMLAAAVGAGVIVLGQPLGLVAPAAIIAGMLPFGYMVRQRRKRLLTIEAQLPDSLDLMSRALRAGHAFSGALNMVASEGPEPIAQEFRTTFDEINFGVSMQDALTNLATRVDSTDVRYFVVAVLIQRETGGNLAELMTNLAVLIRERLKLNATVRVLSAEGRLSAWILGLLPFAVGLMINAVNPRFMSVLWADPLGVRIVVGALALMAVGVVWMWRVISIRV